MNDRDMLLRRLSSAGFAVWEMHMFLDTHPHNQEAFAMLQKYMSEAQKLKAEFESKYGPLSSPDNFDGGQWTWNDSPWPWEIEKGGM